MNKLDRIKNLENELAELKAEIIKDNDVVDWNPSGNKYVVSNVCTIVRQESSERCVNYGVTFETLDQAKQASIAYRRYHRLYRLALELNDGWVPDWGDGQAKHSIYSNISRNANNLEVCKCYNANEVGCIYFKSEKLAQKAIEILGDELL